MPLQPHDVGRRIQYTDRKGVVHFGTLRDVLSGAKMADVKLDTLHATRERYYVPIDTVRLLPEGHPENEQRGGISGQAEVDEQGIQAD